MKPHRPIKKVSADLQVLRFPMPAQAPAKANCLNCSSPLMLSQPDLELSDRLLGICERCKHWYLIDLIDDQGEGVIAGLPGTQIIRNLSRANPEEGISILSQE